MDAHLSSRACEDDVEVKVDKTVCWRETDRDRAEHAGTVDTGAVTAIRRGCYQLQAVHGSTSQTGALLYVAKSRKIRAITRSGMPYSATGKNSTSWRVEPTTP